MPLLAESMLHNMRNGHYTVDGKYNIKQIAADICRYGNDSHVTIQDLRRQLICMKVMGSMMSNAEIKELITQMSFVKFTLNINYVINRADIIDIIEHMFSHLLRELDRTGPTIELKDNYAFYMYASIMLLLLSLSAPNAQSFEIMTKLLKMNSPLEYYGYVTQSYLAKHNPQLLQKCANIAKSKPKSLAAEVIVAGALDVYYKIILHLAYNSLRDVETYIGPIIYTTIQYIGPPATDDDNDKVLLESAMRKMIISAQHPMSDPKYTIEYMRQAHIHNKIFSAIVSLFANMTETSLCNMMPAFGEHYISLSDKFKLYYISMIYRASELNQDEKAREIFGRLITGLHGTPCNTCDDINAKITAPTQLGIEKHKDDNHED
jgi:hypothetical protein